MPQILSKHWSSLSKLGLEQAHGTDSEDEDDGVRKAGGDISQEAALAQISTTAAASKGALGGVTLPGIAVVPDVLVGHKGAA
ncbi:hypothetical protein ACFX15_024683 [Malus domestica]